jgi:hypothetical protein
LHGNLLFEMVAATKHNLTSEQFRDTSFGPFRIGAIVVPFSRRCAI